MGGSFKKILSKSPVQTVGMRLLQGDSLSNAIFKNAGTPAQRGLHQWIHKSYGNLTGANSSQFTPMTKGLNTNPEFFSQQQQMLANMRQQQQANLANLRSQGDLYPSTPATQIPAESAPVAASTAPLAQSKISDTNAPADMPTEFIYKPAKPATQSIAANAFQMPDMSNIKFGGV